MNITMKKSEGANKLKIFIDNNYNALNFSSNSLFLASHCFIFPKEFTA